MMKRDEINKIRDAFEDIYADMRKIGLKKYKNNQITIAKHLKQYIADLKYDMTDGKIDDSDAEHV